MSDLDLVLLEAADLLHARDAECPVSDVELDAVQRELQVILPYSYRRFLKHCGAGRLGNVDLFGLPRNRLWGDIVLMNQLAGCASGSRYLRFASDWIGRSYYFDTAEPQDDGEWPVVVLENERRRLVACNFLDFLGKLILGPITVQLEPLARRPGVAIEESP